jgi:RND family efflux transporter MFP subunit
MQRQHRKIWVVVGILLLLSCGFAYHAWSQQAKTNAREPAKKGAPALVRVAVSQQQDVIVWREVPATFVPLQHVVIRPQISGQIAQILFTDGQYVRAGQLLAVLDDRAIVAEREQAQARLNRIQASFDQVSREQERYQRLLRDQAVSVQELDQLTRQRAELQADLQEALAALKAMDVQQSYTRIVAPFAGQLGIRQVSVGAQVGNNDVNGIVTLTQVDPLAVEFGVPAVVLEQRDGFQQPVELWSLNQPTMLGKSLIRLQDSQINPNTGTLTVRALWPNPDHQWVAGQTLRVRLPAQQFKQAISVPLVAVQQGLSDNFVMVVEQGKVKRTSVTLQGQTDELAIVTGLAAGQTVVVDGLSRLKDGAQVKIESQATSPQGDRL